MPENFGALEYKDITNIHPLAIVALVVLGITMLVVSRRSSVIPMLIILCFIPTTAQKISVLGSDFNLERIMVLFGITRIALRREYVGFIWKPLDTVVVLWFVSYSLIFIVQQGTAAAVVNRLGQAFDAVGVFFVFRCLVRDWNDVDRMILACLWISIPVAALFLLEHRTARNMFSVFGGVPEITVLRQGRLRCQGAFSHPIIAGCFWASVMPFFAAQWWRSGNGKVWACVGLITASVIVICCASSTPILGVASGIIGGVVF